MHPLALTADAGSVGEFTIGSADVDARAQGVASVGKGSTIRAFRVTVGAGNLVYVDDLTGASATLSLAAGDEMSPERGLSIRSINGTGNSVPSAGLTLRAVW